MSKAYTVSAKYVLIFLLMSIGVGSAAPSMATGEATVSGTFTDHQLSSDEIVLILLPDKTALHRYQALASMMKKAGTKFVILEPYAPVRKMLGLKKISTDADGNVIDDEEHLRGEVLCAGASGNVTFILTNIKNQKGDEASEPSVMATVKSIVSRGRVEQPCHVFKGNRSS
jgi:hypothetical protein